MVASVMQLGPKLQHRNIQWVYKRVYSSWFCFSSEWFREKKAKYLFSKDLCGLPFASSLHFQYDYDQVAYLVRRTRLSPPVERACDYTYPTQWDMCFLFLRCPSHRFFRHVNFFTFSFSLHFSIGKMGSLL